MTITIGLAGNPNCGKTTLFNRLTGSSQRVGNWPGVTIDRKSGKLRHAVDTEIVDLPGIYSMSPYSPEERISREFLVKDRPDAVINIVDATNLERNLFLTLQILDTGIPVVIALNMMDALEKRGDTIDAGNLSARLGCPVVPISALKGDGVDQLIERAVQVAKDGNSFQPVRFEDDVEKAISAAADALRGKVKDDELRWFAVKMVEKDPEILEEYSAEAASISGAIDELEQSRDDESDSIIADGRYTFISEAVGESMTRAPVDERGTRSDRIDRIVTSRIWGLPIFLAIMVSLFLLIIGYGDFTGIGTYFTDLVNGWVEEVAQPAVEDWCIENDVSEPLTGLLVTGIIGGVGAVLGFLPQMLWLFLGMCILEDIGYMARAAFVMDRVFRHFGLSGKSFIPVLTGVGCGIPGIMATRTIESERDRRITAMTVTFMPCGAKLPFIALIAGAFFGQNGFVAVFTYILGVAMVLLSGIILKKFKNLAGQPSPFIMELPPYHIPNWFSVAKTTLDRCWAFVKKAGTLILLTCVLIWFLASFTIGLEYIGDSETSGSILQNVGEVIRWVFQPLGWGDDYRFTVSSITGLMAKENIVGTLGVLFGTEVSEEGEEIWEILGNSLSTAAGFSFLLFNLLCAPCFAAIGAMHRELGGWKDTAMAVAYQCLMAYGVASIGYVIGGLIWGNTIELSGIVVCVISAIILAYLLLAKDPFKQLHKKEAESS